MDQNSTELRLSNIGLDQTQIKNILKGKTTLQNLLKTLDCVNVEKCEKKVGNLLYTISTKFPPSIENKRSMICKYILQGKIVNNMQLEAAIEYLEKNRLTDEIDQNDFEKSSGVGVEYTEEQLQNGVQLFIDQNKDELLKVRYQYVFTEYLKKLRATLPFADGGFLTKQLKTSIENLLGPQTEDDKKIFEESKKKKVVPQEKQQKEDQQKDESEHKFKLIDLEARDLASAVNSEKHLKWRKDNFGDVFLSRFPPEPNGYLHIGHAKSIRFNFSLAKQQGGQTYLRLDDTNPEKECQEYIDMIKENLKFLGYQPWKTTYASDNFEKLYQFARQLILKGKAYACFLSKSQASELRRESKPSPYRDTSIEDNLKIFEGMRMGLYKENEVSLRSKIDYAHPNPTLRDPAIYRIRYTPHPHTKNKWCIYPLYDFTHCLCDSLEGISFSCCTLEFEIRRELYYWFLEQLDLYRPYVWEFSRLNVSNTVLSKRKLHRLVFENMVDGWDDPRILTLNGLRRRGYTADSINEFCDLVSVTRRGNENITELHLLEHCIRKDLDIKAPRSMAILDPVLVTITNIPHDQEESFNVSLFPKNPERGARQIVLTNKVFVDRNDVKEVDHEDFWGIAPGKIVGLKYAGAFKVQQVIADGEGNIIEVKIEKLGSDQKPKGYLHWLSSQESVKCEIRVYDLLFTAHDPNELEDYITAFNKDSKITYKNAQMHKDLLTCQKEEKRQFERVGYFTVDIDTNIENQQFIWNRTVSLQEREKVKAMDKVDNKPKKQAKEPKQAKQKV